MPAMEVDLGITVTVNGRPIWRKVKRVKPECAGQLPDDQYDRVLGTAERELMRLLNLVREEAASKAKKADLK